MEDVTQVRKLSEIAKEIWHDWDEKVNYAARPYLEAMGDLDSIKDDYFQDSGKSVVLYFLANANTWRGDVARRVKKELNDMVKSCK